jgi:MFS family permease
MTGVLAALALTISCVGYGAGGLRALGLMNKASTLEHLLWCYVLGLGGLGWLAFFLGISGNFSPTGFIILTLAGIGLAVVFRPSWNSKIFDALLSSGPHRSRLLTWAMGAGLVLVFLFDLAEGFSPPADADTLSYHFALPKLFIEWQRIEFIPRAVDGAVPLLLQMTYTVALALGGELAATTWVMISGWAAVILVFCAAKPHVGIHWALAAALIFATTPAVIYGAGTGQVEVRNALFVMVAVTALAEAIRTEDWRLIAVAAVAAGFFAGSKYTGLLFVAALGMTMFAWRRNFTFALVFSAVALAAGGQWYVWNWIHTGDPIFPLLFSVFEYNDPSVWDEAHHKAFQTMFFNVEKAVPVNIWEFFAYPFKATINPPGAFESLRIGFGPFGLLVMPFAVAGAWVYRKNLRTSRITFYAMSALLFYALWFFTGSSQRVRHLLPIYPLLLVCLIVAASKWADKMRVVAPFVFTIFLVCSLQIGGYLVFSKKFFDYVVEGETPTQFTAKNVPLSTPVSWINTNLNDRNRIFVDERFLSYLLEVPYFYGHKYHQAQVNILPSASDPAKFMIQLRRQGIDYILISNWLNKPPEKPYRGVLGLSWALLSSDCAEVAQRFISDRFASRTLRNLHIIQQPSVVLRLKPGTCQLNKL